MFVELPPSNIHMHLRVFKKKTKIKISVNYEYCSYLYTQSDVLSKK